MEDEVKNLAETDLARSYPRWLRASVLVSALTHDSAILVAAIAAFNFTPPSVKLELGPLDGVWITMLILGSILGGFGAAAHKTVVEIVGCILMTFGLFTWAVAAVSQPQPTPSSLSVAAAFFAGGCLVAWRVFVILIGKFLRVRG